MTNPAAGFALRLDTVTPRLERLASAEVAAGALTTPDGPSGERWEAGQVWAHLAEFIPYWVGETRRVLDGSSTAPTPFGRTKKDPGRIAAIERERSTDRSALWARVRGDMTTLAAFIGEVPDAGWPVVGRHPTLGDMSVEHLVDEFLVGHLEEHADQLEELASANAG